MIDTFDAGTMNTSKNRSTDDDHSDGSEMKMKMKMNTKNIPKMLLLIKEKFNQRSEETNDPDKKYEEFFVILARGTGIHTKYPGLNPTSIHVPLAMYTRSEDATEKHNMLKKSGVLTNDEIQYSIKCLTSYEIIKFLKLNFIIDNDNEYLNELQEYCTKIFKITQPNVFYQKGIFSIPDLTLKVPNFKSFTTATTTTKQ